MKKIAKFVMLCLTIYTIYGGGRVLAQSIMLENFDGSAPPVNKEGIGYPNPYQGPGEATFSINTSDSVSGNNLRMHIITTADTLQAQFNPYNGTSREFARTYAGCGWPSSCGDPASWQFNTYNRMRYWVKLSPQIQPMDLNGGNNFNMGIYVKSVVINDPNSDENGGNHFYQNLNLPNTNSWIQVIINAHPDHARGNPGDTDPGVLLYPTSATQSAYGSGDPPSTYNYFDTLTRFYLEINDVVQSAPADIGLDQMEFYREPNVEDDLRVHTLAGTYLPATNRLILTWNRWKPEDTIKHEVHYAFSDIHTLGWANATPAPNGIIVPPGSGGYNSMSYDTTALPLTGHSMVYVAIKSQNSTLFSQIAIPLSGSSTPLAPPTNLRVMP